MVGDGDLFRSTVEIAEGGVSSVERARLPSRLMTSRFYLEHAFRLSHEELVALRSVNIV